MANGGVDWGGGWVGGFQAKDPPNSVGDEEGAFASEIRSETHDATQGGHDRDYRGFVIFHRDLFARDKLTIRASDLRSREGGEYVLTAHHFACAEADGETPMVDLLAYRLLTRWLKLCEDTLSSDKKSRKTDFREQFREVKVIGRDEKIGLERGDGAQRITTLNPCRFCKICIKGPHAPDSFYGNGPIKWRGGKYPVIEKIPTHAECYTSNSIFLS